MNAPVDDELAPDQDGFWQAITTKVAEIDHGLVWGDLAEARNALRDLPGSLRMLGLADLGALAETLWQGFQTDPRDEARQVELALLKTAVEAARDEGGLIPLVAAAKDLRRVLIAADGPLTPKARDLKATGWRFTVAASQAAALVWLRIGDVVAVLWDPACEAFPEAWLGELPPTMPVISIGNVASPRITASLPTVFTFDALADALEALNT